jgi:predicted nucleic acid-binding protein
MYVDSSVLTKFFSAEPDSEACAAKVAGSFVVSSELAYGELFSALLRKERTGSLSRTYRDRGWQKFENRIADQSLFLARLDGSTVRLAKDIMQHLHPQVPLRTLDAIHLATCASVVAGPLFTTDKRMHKAALLLKIPVLEP